MAFAAKHTIPLADQEPCRDGRVAEPAFLPPVSGSIRQAGCRVSATSRRQSWRLIASVFLPFVAGYYLSYLFRTINALISDQLTTEFALGAGDLGLLTSVFFLVFAAAQIPVGVLLDRYGPRRVQGALLLVAAAGAALFGMSDGFAALVIARGLMGLGGAGAFSAGLKAIVLWFPSEHVALANGYMIMLGALGAVTATAPAQRLLDVIGWRGLFELLAVLAAGSAALVCVVVPEHASSRALQPPSLKAVYTDLRFWRLAPLSATCAGSAWALQGLWAAPWFTDVERADRATLIMNLFIMAVAVCVGALGLGTIADRMRRAGRSLQAMLAAVAIGFIAAELSLVLSIPVPTVLPWSIVAMVGASTVLSYAIMTEYFPQEIAGRANAALNVFHLGWAFVAQYGIGLITSTWSSHDGHYPAMAYQVAFGLNSALQVVALVWFELPRLMALTSRLGPRSPKKSANCCTNPRALTPYRRALAVWTECLSSVRVQASSWRLAAAGSATLCVVLAFALGIAIRRAAVIPYIVHLDRLNEPHAAHSSQRVPSDAQIAYFLARFVKDIRSRSIDPIVVRSNWEDALNYATDRAAQTISDYARDTNAFAQIGLRPIVVEVLYVVRASDSSFEIHWQEEIHERGRIVQTSSFTGTADIILNPAGTAGDLRNPLGLYVHAFRWSRDK